MATRHDLEMYPGLIMLTGRASCDLEVKNTPPILATGIVFAVSEFHSYRSWGQG